MDQAMEVDFVMDEEDPDIVKMQEEARAMEERARAAEAEFEAMHDVETAQQEDGEVDSQSVVPEKLHIRGLDSLTTADIKAYVKEWYQSEDLFKRVEWIDDTSANLIFENAEAATDALALLSLDMVPDELALRPAKAMSTHPNIQLQIRQAIAADVKLPGAKDRSRFYLFNPQYDPDVRAQNRKRRYADERGGSQQKRRRDDGRRGSVEASTFNVDFYDDSTALPDPEVQSKRSQMEDLFKNRKSNIQPRATKTKDGRLRHRSASPDRDGDGMYGFEEEQPYRRTARQRSATPPHLRKARRRDQDLEDVNREKELFPELNSATHKRSDAQDLHPDQVANIRGNERQSKTVKGDLFSRISMPGQRSGRLNGDPGGRSQNNGAQEFAILGAAKTENPLVKELFPSKVSGPKKDLFDGRIKGRATQRRRAEDLF